MNGSDGDYTNVRNPIASISILPDPQIFRSI